MNRISVFLCSTLFLSLLMLAPAARSASNDPNDLFHLSLEELMAMEIVTATKSMVKLNDAPAAVTVISAEDIKRYGYRNLTEALARVPEVYTRYEGHNMGSDFRGFFTNNTRRQVLFLLDGHRMNDRFHFGDFYPDVINDLSSVKRIEVIRGPGAALYGNNAILGVVNVITNDAGELNVGDRRVETHFSADQIDSDSAVFKYQASLRERFSDRTDLFLDLCWYDGEVAYDTKTSGYDRPWTGSKADNGHDVAHIKTHTDFFTDVEGASFDGGRQLPNAMLRFTAGDFALGAFNHTKITSWVWPKDNVTFNHSDNTRSWGTSAVFMEWRPEDAALKRYDILARISYNNNTNREIADFSTKDTIGAESLSYQRLTGIYANPRWVRTPTGGFMDYTATLDPENFSDSTADANGGGSQFHYAGTDRSMGLELQLTPVKSDIFTLQAGANYENARYENFQWYAYRNGDFIGWAPWGGITDKGWYAGAWLQATVTPVKRLSIIGGARYDYQKIEEVYRQLGGEQLYENTDGKYTPIRHEDATVDDFTPRIAVNYYLNETDNIRLIYARAFRAMPPQELIRLPVDYGKADSEETDNYEIIGSFRFFEHFNLTLNAFYLTSNLTYQWNPAAAAFSKGSGWRNTGGSAALTYVSPEKNFEAWVNTTAYRLRRPTNALQFMSGEPNQYEPLDSPTSLFKTGASYLTRTQTTVSGELYYNGSVTLFTPALNNVEDSASSTAYSVYNVPSSFSVNLAVRQDFAFFGWNGFHALFKIDNVLDTDVWYGLNMDAQNSWDYHLYARPNQIPGFGRRFYVQLGYAF